MKTYPLYKEKMIKKSHRHTVMDGRVVTFAHDFDKHEGILGERYVATGPIVVSVSQNGVHVHKAELVNKAHLRIFKQVMSMAEYEHNKLIEADGRPDDNWDGNPKEIELKNYG